MGQSGGLVAAAGADFKHFAVRCQFQVFGH